MKQIKDNYDKEYKKSDINDIVVQKDVKIASTQSDITSGNITYSPMDILSIIQSIDINNSSLSTDYIKTHKIEGFIGYLKNFYLNLSMSGKNDPEILKINNYMRKLIYSFSNAVNSGFELVASAAMSGMVDVIEFITRDIDYARNTYPEVFDEYMENYFKYMDCFLVLVGISRRVDLTSRTVQRYKSNLNQKERAYQYTIDTLKKDVESDRELLSQVYEFQQKTFNESSSLWSEEMHELYQKMISLRIQKFNAQYEKFLLDSEEKKLNESVMARTQLISTLKANRPSPEDVNIVEVLEGIYHDALEKSKKTNQELFQISKNANDFNNTINDNNGI